jgi:hypothetical protein
MAPGTRGRPLEETEEQRQHRVDVSSYTRITVVRIAHVANSRSTAPRSGNEMSWTSNRPEDCPIAPISVSECCSIQSLTLSTVRQLD